MKENKSFAFVSVIIIHENKNWRAIKTTKKFAHLKTYQLILCISQANIITVMQLFHK